jgi:uncharacterized protein YjiS (DUF1127 family)
MSATLCYTASPVSSSRSQRAVTGQRFESSSDVRSLLNLWWERAVARRRLAEMEDYMLMDIGLNKVEAAAEAKKPFWAA